MADLPEKLWLNAEAEKVQARLLAFAKNHIAAAESQFIGKSVHPIEIVNAQERARMEVQHLIDEAVRLENIFTTYVFFVPKASP